MTKPKCGQCNERDVFSKGLCSGCYGRNWREQRKAERAAAIVEHLPPKQLTSGVTEGEIEAIQGEIIHDAPRVPETHLTALNPAEMQASQADMRAHLEQRLTVIEREIIEANAALSEARRNGWATGALTSARNRLVDDETYYNKILMALEAGHAIIPEFPVEVFAVRQGVPEGPVKQTYIGAVNAADTYTGRPANADCAPAGMGEYRNPEPKTFRNTVENKSPGSQERGEPRYYTTIHRTGRSVGPIVFPSMTARSPIMHATAAAMKDKVFDQIGVCLPVVPARGERRVVTRTRRMGDPLVIGQILHKSVGSKQKCVSFIIAWYLNLNDL